MATFDRPRAAATAALLRRLGFRLLDTSAVLAAQAAGETLTAFESPGIKGERILHLTNGDSVAGTLRDSRLPGEVSVTADLLHEGPAPAGLSAERWRKVRARYLAENGYDGYDECLGHLAEWDRRVEEASNYEEVVLWFEHDLFDQLNLIRLVTLLSDLPLAGTRLSLLSISEFPGVVPFHGLGQLTAEQLAGLFDERRPISRVQIALAREAWLAFCSANPHDLEVLLVRDTYVLPDLAAALHRHLEEFPATTDGLSRTERQALATLAGETLPFSLLFRAVQAMEERVFQGDLSFLRTLRGLAGGPHPLLRLEPSASGSLHSQRVSITRTGRQVLERQQDWIYIAGIDRWLGGVHLRGIESPWRWDPESRRLFRAGLR